MVAGFEGYAVPMAPTAEQFAFMMGQRGMVPDASWVAVEGDVVRAVWLVSIREGRGYLIASGTAAEWRGNGIARRMGEASIADLAARGVGTYWTEVLHGNNAARALYDRLGFTTAREFSWYDLTPSGDGLGEICAWGDVVAEAAACRDWEPSWQNSDASLAAVSDGITVVQLRDARGLVGYAAMVTASGTVAQIAVREDARRRGVARGLLARLGALSPKGALRLANVQSDDAGFAAAAAALGAVPDLGQTELRRTL